MRTSGACAAFTLQGNSTTCRLQDTTDCCWWGCDCRRHRTRLAGSQQYVARLDPSGWGWSCGVAELVTRIGSTWVWAGPLTFCLPCPSAVSLPTLQPAHTAAAQQLLLFPSPKPPEIARTKLRRQLAAINQPAPHYCGTTQPRPHTLRSLSSAVLTCAARPPPRTRCPHHSRSRPPSCCRAAHPRAAGRYQRLPR